MPSPSLSTSASAAPLPSRLTIATPSGALTRGDIRRDPFILAHPPRLFIWPQGRARPRGVPELDRTLLERVAPAQIKRAEDEMRSQNGDIYASLNRFPSRASVSRSGATLQYP